MWPIRLIYLKIFRKIGLSHAEILILKLLYTTFKSSIFVSELYEFCIDLINSCDFWSDVFESTSMTELTILCIASFHNVLDLCRYQLIVVLAIIF